MCVLEGKPFFGPFPLFPSPHPCSPFHGCHSVLRHRYLRVWHFLRQPTMQLFFFFCNFQKNLSGKSCAVSFFTFRSVLILSLSYNCKDTQPGSSFFNSSNVPKYSCLSFHSPILSCYMVFQIVDIPKHTLFICVTQSSLLCLRGIFINMYKLLSDFLHQHGLLLST